MIYPVNAQVSGKVTHNDIPLPYVTVVILNSSDSSVVFGDLTASDGTFSIKNVNPGYYRLHLSFIGFAKWYSEVFTISTGAPAKNFGTVAMTEETTVLADVSVTAQKMQIVQTMEGTTVNLQNSILTKGNNALQVLERSPGVVLDQRNNNITLNGQSGILIMINGRTIRMSPAEVIGMLEGMSADNLEKIELLTNPSSKYDADGGAGIINLVVKKSVDEGFNGTVSASYGYGWGPKEAVNLNVNRRKGSGNYYGSYSFNHDDSFTDFHAVGKQTMPLLGGEFNFNFANHAARERFSHNAMVGVEKEIGKSFLLGGNILYNHFILKTDIRNDAHYLFADDSYLTADINVYGKGLQQNLTSTLFTEKRFKDDSKLSFDGDYIFYTNLAPTIVTSSYADIDGNQLDPNNEAFTSGNRGESVTEINIGVVKLDYEGELTNNVRIESGVKSTYSTTTNNAFIESFREQEWVTYDRNKTNLKVVEKINAGYLSIRLTIDSLTTLTTGVRYEHWDRDFSDEALDKRFGKLFPSAFFTRTLTPSSSLQLVYNRRITRPDYNDLTNFLRYNDPASVFTGTPQLQPAISDNIKLGFIFHGDMNISLNYVNENNSIARFQLKENDGSDLVIIAPQNVNYLRTIGIQGHFPITIKDWWSFTAGGNFNRRKFSISYTRIPVEHKYFAYNIYINQTFSFPKNFSVELTGLYNSNQYNGSIRVNRYGSLNAGVKRNFGGYGSLQLSVTDLFKSNTVKSEYGALTEEAFNAQSTVRFQPESTNARIVRLTYSTRFGNSKTKVRRQRQAGSQEEKSRIGL